jgi:hypothetical protein
MKTKYPEVSRVIKKSIKINADIPVTERSLEQHNSSRVPIISIIKPKKVLNNDLNVRGITKCIDEKTQNTPREDTIPRGDTAPKGDGLGDCTAETEDIEQQKKM